jgi:hypothetical protein
VPIYVHADNDRIYQVDLDARNVRIAFEGQLVRAAGLLARTAPTQDVSLVVLTDDAVLKLDRENRIVRRFPLPADLREASFAWVETTPGTIVTLAGSDLDERTGKGLWQVSWFDDSGRLLRRDETWVQRPPHADLRILLAAMLSPAVANWHFIDPLHMHYYPTWTQYLNALGRGLAAGWPVVLLVHFVAGVLAWLAYRRLVRYGASRAERVVCPVFVLVLGLPGWLGFRFARSWPVLEACPNCAVVVPRDRVPCAVCGADFPSPALRGTEVFA